MSNETSKSRNTMRGNPEEKKFKIHGIEFIRYGSCHQCGTCDCKEQPCPHRYVKDGLHWCDIYDERESMCEECHESHAGCLVFPDNPWIGVIRQGKCGYHFRRVDGKPMDDLPFLNGEPYLLK